MDLRQATPAAVLSCSERVYSMDVRNRLMAIVTADDQISLVDLTNPTVFFKKIKSPLRHQTRVISCYPDGRGFALGGIDGRCAFQMADDKDSASNFTFKCHRENVPSGSNVFAINDISFHPVHGTYSTAGADGTFHYWDKDQRARLKAFPKVGGAISATAFSRTGSLFAYATSYDWSMGYVHNTAQYPIKVMVHPVDDTECRPRGSNKR